MYQVFLQSLSVHLLSGYLRRMNHLLLIDHGKEYFNFLISYSIYSFVSFILMIVLIGFLTIWLVGIYAFVFTIIAAVKAYDGKEYRIPLVIRLIK